jgi:outer membrane protein TolC
MKYLYLFLLIIPPSLHSRIYDLQYCIETGLEKNYDIRIIRNDEQISINNVTPGNAGFLPVIDIEAGYSGDVDHYSNNKSYPVDEALNQGANIGLNMSWTIFDGFEMQTNYKRLKQFRTIGELNTRQVIENWIANLVAEYYNYVNQNIRLSNLKYALSLSKERLRIAEAKYDIGSDSKLDMLQARVDFNADSSNLIRQYEVVYTSGVSLNRMMAVEDVAASIVVGDTVIIPNSLLDEQALKQAMQTANTSLLIAAKNLTVSELDEKMLDGHHYPYLKFNAGYGYSLNTYASGNPRRTDKLGLNYGFTLGFNIFEGFNHQREHKNARIAISNSKLRYEQTLLSLQADFASMWIAYATNLDLIQLERENLQTARDNYEKAIDRYRLGTLAGIELREAQNSLLNAEERLLQAEFNTKLCEISLMQISGKAGEYLVKY